MHHANSIMSSLPLSAALRRIVCHAASASVAGEPLSRRTPPYLGSAASAPQEQQRPSGTPAKNAKQHES